MVPLGDPPLHGSTCLKKHRSSYPTIPGQQMKLDPSILPKIWDVEDARSECTSHGWDKTSAAAWEVPEDSQDGPFCFVEPETSDEDEWNEVPFDESEWGEEPGASPLPEEDAEETQREFERTLRRNIFRFLAQFRDRRSPSPALKDAEEQDDSLPGVREDCLRRPSGGLRLGRSAEEWLQGRTAAPASSRPPTPAETRRPAAPAMDASPEEHPGGLQSLLPHKQLPLERRHFPSAPTKGEDWTQQQSSTD